MCSLFLTVAVLNLTTQSHPDSPHALPSLIALRIALDSIYSQHASTAARYAARLTRGSMTLTPSAIRPTNTTLPTSPPPTASHPSPAWPTPPSLATVAPCTTAMLSPTTTCGASTSMPTVMTAATPPPLCVRPSPTPVTFLTPSPPTVRPPSPPSTWSASSNAASHSPSSLPLPTLMTGSVTPCKMRQTTTPAMTHPQGDMVRDAARNIWC
mmetsp:Transcript_10103/g.23022  ORF Transcript_10103/g.23022 Transcript_10103/m.23022 type:complete len:211 (+) Transcript_10103:469-1101(+)